MLLNTLEIFTFRTGSGSNLGTIIERNRIHSGVNGVTFTRRVY